MAVDKEKLEGDASVSRFYKIVLSWDYHRLLKESKQKEEGKIDDGIGIAKVKDSYKNVDDDLSTYEPLLFEEVKSQIVQKKDEDESIHLRRGNLEE